MSTSHEPLGAFPHDAAYKAMYSHPEAILGLRRYLVEPNGPLSLQALNALDFEGVEKLPTEWVSKDFRRRYGDLVWRIPFQDANGDTAPRTWLIILLEFQSEDDRRMSLRVFWYACQLWRDLEAQGVLAENGRRPPLLPVVIHNGAVPWRSPRQLSDWTLEPFPPALRTELFSLQPSIGLHVVDFPAYRKDDLVAGNLTSLQIGFEHARPRDFARLLPALADLPGAGLRRTAYNWVRLRAKHYFGIELEPIEETDMGTTAFRSRLDENMKRATEAWFADGLKQGRAEGIEQGRRSGIEQQRSSLGRQVAVKFGPEAAQRFGRLLVEVHEADKLADLAVALLTTDSEAELEAELKQLGVGHRP